jgi:hypothetical protein
VKDGNIKHSVISPARNALGQLVDYKMVKITMAFTFNDPLFLKPTHIKLSCLVMYGNNII